MHFAKNSSFQSKDFLHFLAKGRKITLRGRSSMTWSVNLRVQYLRMRRNNKRERPNLDSYLGYSAGMVWDTSLA